MKRRFLPLTLFLFFAFPGLAQQRCATVNYTRHAQIADRSLIQRQNTINQFVKSQLSHPAQPGIASRPAALTLITIPVVVHVVYHLPEQNIPDEAISNQLAVLNRDYQRANFDTVNTPGVFRPVAADCKISFVLAKVDQQGRATNGIERIYSPVSKWEIEEDKVKFKSSYGADGWDATHYLNIWVCNLDDLLGYASVLGDSPKKDGVVIHYGVFDNLNDGGPFNSGRTAVHEIGHWLGLVHLWGDADCGDDGVADTPAQSTFTTGCPGGTRLSCNNAPTGDMYMNYMDYTNDPCMNLFTRGQCDKMRALFETGGMRSGLLTSRALGIPWVAGIILPDDNPRWLFPKVYPNPAGASIVIDLKYDPRWVGEELIITNVAGQVLTRHRIEATVETIDISKLNKGIYFIHGTKDELFMSEKFVRL